MSVVEGLRIQRRLRLLSYRSWLDPERWAEHGYKGNGFNPAEGLITNWLVPGNTVVHVRLSISCGQRYRGKLSRAVYGAGAAPGGFETRILRGLDELGWDAAGH